MAQNERGFEEKRNFIRMSLNVSATLSMESGQEIEVTCIDLSAAGMAIETAELVPMNSKVHVSIQSPSTQFNSMSADGQVTRSRDLGNGRFELGVEIDKID